MKNYRYMIYCAALSIVAVQACRTNGSKGGLSGIQENGSTCGNNGNPGLLSGEFSVLLHNGNTARWSYTLSPSSSTAYAGTSASPVAAMVFDSKITVGASSSPIGSSSPTLTNDTNVQMHFTASCPQPICYGSDDGKIIVGVDASKTSAYVTSYFGYIQSSITNYPSSYGCSSVPYSPTPQPTSVCSAYSSNQSSCMQAVGCVWISDTTSPCTPSSTTSCPPVNINGRCTPITATTATSTSTYPYTSTYTSTSTYSDTSAYTSTAITTLNAASCPNNRYCSGGSGWGWLSNGESGCSSSSAGFKSQYNGCSCKC